MGKYKLSKFKKDKLLISIQKAKTVPAPENSLGQWIGYFIDEGTTAILEEICPTLSTTKQEIDYGPKEGESQIKLNNTLGQEKQIDHIIKINSKMAILVESKWLKDQRHLNDKGAWVLMMNDILLENHQLKGIVVVLAGPWEGMRAVIEKRAKIAIIPEDCVYKTLNKYGIKITIDRVRNAYENPGETLKTLIDTIESAMKDNYDLVKEIGYEIVNTKKNEIKRCIQNYL